MRLVEVLIVLSAAITQSGDLARDGQALWAPGNGVGAATGVALAAAAHSTHDNWRPQLRGKWFADHPSTMTDVYGSSAFILPSSVALWTVGHLAGRPAAHRVGRNLTRMLVLTQFVVAPIKLASHRRRPDGSDRYSFPSGHTANTFAVARYIQRDFGTPASILPYGLAAATAMGRMEGGRHYLSDVVMGATLGFIVGNTVRLDRPAAPQSARLRLDPMTAPGTGLRLTVPLR